MVKPGWMEVYGKEVQSDDAPIWSPLIRTKKSKQQKLKLKRTSDQAASAVFGSDVARRDGRRGQID